MGHISLSVGLSAISIERHFCGDSIYITNNLRCPTLLPDSCPMTYNMLAAG
jgi:hypothetical protein